MVSKVVSLSAQDKTAECQLRTEEQLQASFWDTGGLVCAHECMHICECVPVCIHVDLSIQVVPFGKITAQSYLQSQSEIPTFRKNNLGREGGDIFHCINDATHLCRLPEMSVKIKGAGDDPWRGSRWDPEPRGHRLTAGAFILSPGLPP